MKTVNTNDLKPGMVAAETVTKGDQVIMEKGTALTRRLIMRLSFYNIDSISIEESDVDYDAAPQQLTPAGPQSVVTSYAQKLKTSKEFHSFQIDHSIVLSSIRTNLENYIKDGTPMDLDLMLKQTIDLSHSCKTSLELFDMLHNMRSSDDSVYAHSLNVALISRRLGRWMKLDDEKLNMITISGLLHDIGKLKIPEEILNKPGKYTDEEFELVQKHPKLGYDLLKSLNIDDHIKKAALSHHERCDGSGYPMGLTMEYTDDCAMLIAIADVYDAMTAARSYRAPLCPFQVIANFEKDGLQKYKPKYILTFLSRMASMYQNNRILLNDGRSANIVMLNQNYLSKPIVQFDDGICLDLSTQSELHIQAIL